MTITNLFAQFCRTSGTNLPICLLLQGWSGEASDFLYSNMQRIADYGFFVCAVGMRGRDGADGSRDASGREIYDIYDALQYIRSHYAGVVSPTLAGIVGESGGGGNVLAAACKFPDAWSFVIDYYGMSDYGRSFDYGWYYYSSLQNECAASVGGTPAQVPNRYYARDATIAITNYSGGSLQMFHDTEDAAVKFYHATRIRDSKDAAGQINYALNSSTIGDPTRYTHGLAWDSAAMLAAEAIWTPVALAQPSWTIPASGTVTVIGYIVTKRFSIWLNTNGTATLGIDGAATVAYNTATNTYTVTPLTTGGLDVTITQGAKTGSATNITAATEIVVA